MHEDLKATKYLSLKGIKGDFDRVRQQFDLGSAIYFGKDPEHTLPYRHLFLAYDHLKFLCDPALNPGTWERSPVLKLHGDREPIPAVRYEVTGRPHSVVQDLQAALKTLGFDSEFCGPLYLERYFVYISGEDAYRRFSKMVEEDAPVLATHANSSCPALVEKVGPDDGTA